MTHRVRDHREVFRRRDAQNICYMEPPTLAEDGNGRCPCLEQQGDLRILFDTRIRPAGTAERGKFRVREPAAPYRFEERRVLRVRARPAALDIVDAERVQFFGDANFIEDAKRDALALCTVAQGRIVNGQGYGAQMEKPPLFEARLIKHSAGNPSAGCRRLLPPPEAS
jgi:hypothetical protein